MQPAATWYRGDVAALITALTSAEALATHQERLGNELHGLADREMIAHIRAVSRWISTAQSEGFDRFCARSRGEADALLSDLLASALWHGDALPLTPLTDAASDNGAIPEHAPRGLLGADTTRDGLRVWVRAADLIAVARHRPAGSLADAAERGCGGSC